MNIDELTSLLPPPKSPVEAIQIASWDVVENKLGTKLPGDYKLFIQTYGTGYIGNYFVIWNPFSSDSFLNLIERAREKLSELVSARKIYKEEFDEDFPPYPIYPEPGGIFPFGVTIDGHMFFWKTTGSPEEWTIILHENRSTNYEEHLYTMSRFLINLFGKTIPYTMLYSEDVETWNFTPVDTNPN